jgi:hypothetical protein
MLVEHLLHLTEAVLVLFGGLKFCHEIYEVIHHLLKLKIVVRLLR